MKKPPEQLFVHKNTVRYRIAKMSEIFEYRFHGR
ncbi:MAG: helix-turn-helix domain-containing protein [Coprococcus sp.]